MNTTFTTGPMGAGKSKTLIENFREDKTTCLAFAASLDRETGSLGTIESRNGEYIYALKLKSSQHESVIKFLKGMFSIDGLETVYIDEVQFLLQSTVEEILNMAVEHDVNVHLFGLSTTFTGADFEASRFLLDNLPKDCIKQLSMYCQSDSCLEQAEFNARIVDDKVVREGETFVSEKSKYLALCKKHYFI